MNHIHKLQDENASQAAQLEAMRKELENLRVYLQSPKFRSGDDLDGYVACQDVLNRLDNVDAARRNSMAEAAAEATMRERERKAKARA